MHQTASRAGAHHQLDIGHDIIRKRRPFQVLRALRAVPKRNWLILLLVGLPFLYYVTQQFKAQIHFELEGEQDVFSLPTCDERLQRFNLDFVNHLRLSLTRYALDRRRIYESMAVAIASRGLSLGGVITQGLTQTDLFTTHHDERSGQLRVTPKLRGLETPVRACILPVQDPVVSSRIRTAVELLLLPLLPVAGAWLQDDRIYHSTLFHTSSHSVPVLAGPEEVEAEAATITSVAQRTCPIRAVLERIIITPSGVIVACWQPVPSKESGEPALLRAALAAALPTAPPKEGQMVSEPAILHTTIARLLDSPAGAAPPAPVIMQAVLNMSMFLCGLATTFRDIWFIEEKDLLALALNGRYEKHVAPLHCA